MLKNITTSFKNKCNASELTLEEYVVLNNTNIPVKAKLKDDCYENGNFIGTFIFKQISFDAPNNYNFRNQEFEYYKKVSGESIKIGTFITTEIKDNDSTETISIVGMDYGLKTQVQYTSNLDYSSGTVTLKNVWDECCTLSGLTSGINSFANDSFIVDSDQFTGTGATIRDVFKAIAQSSCDFVKIMNDDKIYLILHESTSEVINEYTDLDDKRDTLPINAVSLGMSQVEGEEVTKIAEGVTPGNEHWLIINDNPFAYTTAKRQALINAIFNKINTFGYSSFKAVTSFKPYMTCGDLLQFKRKDGTLVNSILLRYEHNFDEITLEAPSVIKSTVNYTYPQNAISISKKALFKVDQAENEITAIVEQIQGDDGLEQRVSRVETKQTATDYTVNIISTNINTNNGDIEAVKTTNGFTFDNNGLNIYTNENTYNTLINNIGTYYKDGNKILSQTTKDGTISKDMVLYGKYYYGVDENLAVENFTKDDAMFVAYKLTDSLGEECFSHFYNSPD